MKFTLAILCVALFALPAAAHHPGDIDWGTFGMDESQVANYAGNPDGSTDSPGFGSADFFYINASQVLAYTITWNNLIGDLTAIHLHGPAAAGQNATQHLFDVSADAQAVIDAGVGRRNGFVSGIVDLSGPHDHGGGALTPEYILETLESGLAYINVHTTSFSMGEIRGQFPSIESVPTPTAASMILAGVALAARRRRRSA